jgi:hypothetical protein
MSDAGHDHLRRVSRDRPENGPGPPVEELEAAHREYLDTVGRISGAGPYPER